MGTSHRLTKHGRRRYLDRINPGASDREILQVAQAGLPGWVFVWGPDRREGFRLVTVLKDGWVYILPPGGKAT